MADAASFNFDPERYNKRLAIIVPYRDRLNHLSQFIPHITSYFERDKLDRQIDVTINVVEQSAGTPFNRGKLKNAGFALVRDSCDYVCFHDVDYLPIWADYSWSMMPARLAWFGLTLREDWTNFFGAVCLFSNEAFVRADGFPNCYWGWGPEDLELGYRARITAGDFERRDGTFASLPHAHAGFSAPGVWTEEARGTHEIFLSRRDRLDQFIGKDGLSNLDFRLLGKAPLALGGRSFPRCWHYVVDVQAAD